MSKDFFIRATINRNPLTRIMVCWPYNETVLDENIKEVVDSMIEHYLPDYGHDYDQSVQSEYDYFLNIIINDISGKVIWSLAPHSKCAMDTQQMLNCNGRPVNYFELPLEIE